MPAWHRSPVGPAHRKDVVPRPSDLTEWRICKDMTLSTEVRNIAHQRIRDIKAEMPGAEIQEEWMEDRVVLSVMKESRTVECDFVESASSCHQTRRMSEYYDVLGKGFMLRIIVPQNNVSGEIVRMKMVKGASRFAIFGYENNVITSAKA